MRKKRILKKPQIYIFKRDKLIKKKCPICKKFKSVSEFDKSKERQCGIHCYCKKCRHKKELKTAKKRQKIYIASLRHKAYFIVANNDKPKCMMSKIWNCCNDPYNALFLSLDHIEGDGARHKRKIKATASVCLYRWVIKHPQEAKKGLQILCMNAQVMKKRVNSEYGTKER